MKAATRTTTDENGLPSRFEAYIAVDIPEWLRVPVYAAAAFVTIAVSEMARS